MTEPTTKPGLGFNSREHTRTFESVPLPQQTLERGVRIPNNIFKE